MQTTITCPNCGTEIDISKSLYAELERKAKAKLENEARQHRDEYKAAMRELKDKEEALKEEKDSFEKKLQKATQEQVEQMLKTEKRRLEEDLRHRLAEEQKEQLDLMRKELAQKSEQVKELNKSKAEIEQLKREKEELAAKARFEAEMELSRRLAEEKLKLKRTLDEEIALKLRAKDEQIEQMRRDIEAARRKAEQGSMQIQGEALELTIENWLRRNFPFDTVEEVKKGAFGADCIQTVHTRETQNCGVICYESKNTKAWSDAWIPKLKQDMLKTGADIGVLVTSVYPSGMERMGFVDGIWVCTLEEFRGSAALLRDSLIRIHAVLEKEENKSDKMTLLYNYLTGNEFQMQLKAIADGFMAMQSELDKEKRSLMASWKRRQKLIDGVLKNTTEMYGALHGIAGSGSLGHIAALELSEDENDDDDNRDETPELEDWDGCDA